MAKFIVRLFVLVLFVGTCSIYFTRDIREDATREQERLAKLTPEQRAQEAAGRAAEAERQIAAIAADADRVKATRAEEAAKRKAAKADQVAPQTIPEKKEPGIKVTVAAWQTAKEVVRACLEYPLDAEFPSAWGSDVDYFDEGKSVHVASTVKAKNGFGAIHTLPWKAWFRIDGESLHLTYCELDGKPVFNEQQQAHEQAAPEKSVAGKTRGPALTEEERLEQKNRRIAETERAKEKAGGHKDAAAANMLRIAKGFRTNGNDEAYRKWLHKVVDGYPGTPTAKEAKGLLEE